MKKVLLFVVCALLLVSIVGGCKKEDKTIRIGATPSPHAVVLEECVKEILKEKGYTLVVESYGSYEVINPATASKNLDANFFQHRPYLATTEEAKDLVMVCGIHYEPQGLYSKSGKTLADVEGAVIAVPNDATNRARALNLLAQEGIITLSKNDLTVTVDDITENTKSVEIKEVAADALTTVLTSVDFAVLPGNYALSAGMTLADAVAYEDPNSNAADTFSNGIAVHKDNVATAKIKALIEALQDPRVKKFYEEKFGDSAVYSFVLY